jgi:hypothetical protein
MLLCLRFAVVSAITVTSLATASLAAAQAGAPPAGAPPLPARPAPAPAAAPPVAPAPGPVAPAPAPVAPAPAPGPAPAPAPDMTQPAPPPTATSPSSGPPPVYYPAPPPQQPYGPGPYSAPPPGGYPPPPAPEPSRGAHLHDGFYLRLGLGVGRTGASFRNDNSRELDGSVEGSLVSAAAAFELAIGGTPAPGLVIGGGFFSGGSGEVESSDLSVDGRPVPRIKYSQLTFTLLGPFIDYYFDERSGFHLQGALGLAYMDVGTGKRGSTTVTDERTLGGLGFMLGGGYEWFVGDQWSLGGLLRMRYGALETDNDDDERWTFQTLAIPEILFNATFH